MKYKKIGDILILDNKYSDNNFEELSKKHNVKTIMKIDHIQGTKREPIYKVLYGSETETIHKENGCLFKLDLAKVMKAKIKNRPDLGKDERVGRRVIFESNKSYPVVLSPMLDKESLKEPFLEYLSYYYDINEIKEKR